MLALPGLERLVPEPMETGRTPLPRPTPALAELIDAIPRLSRGNVAVIGDVMLDRYLYGGVRRISPEAPVPVLAVEREAAMIRREPRSPGSSAASAAWSHGS